MRIILILALPLITLALGLVSAFNDVKSNRRAATFLLICMFGSTLGTLYTGYEDYEEKQAESRQAKADRASAAADRTSEISSRKTLESTVDSESKAIAALTDKTATVADGVAVLAKHFGLSPQTPLTPERLHTSAAADAIYNQLLPTVRAEQQLSPRVVTYFPKEVDAQTVLAALRRGNFVVHELQGNPNNINKPTNAVWVGNALSLADAKFVVATLIRAGVPIISVRRLKNSSEKPRSDLIEVGTDASLAGRPAMTIDQLNALTDADIERSPA